MHSTHNRRRHRASDNPSHYGGVDLDENLPLLVSRVDEPHSSHSRTHSHQHVQRSPSRHEYPATNENPSRDHQRHDRWRQAESSYPSNHDRYAHSASAENNDAHRREDYYDRGEDRYSTSMARGWTEHPDRDFASSSRADRAWTSNSRYETGTTEYSRWESREREAVRDDYAAPSHRRDSHENEESSRARDYSWSTRDQEWDREPTQRRQEWSRDTRSSWTPRTTTTHTLPVQDRTWKPAASWQSGERSQQSIQSGGGQNKRNKKKQSQSQTRRSWQTKEYGRKPYDWRDGPSNWQDHSTHRDKGKTSVYDKSQSGHETRGTKRRQSSISRSRSRTPPSRSPSITYSRTSKRPRRPAESPLRNERVSSRSRSRSRSRTRSLTTSPRPRSIKSDARRARKSKSPYSAASHRSDDERGYRRSRSASSSSGSSRSPTSRRRSLHRLPVSYTLKTKDLPLERHPRSQLKSYGLSVRSVDSVNRKDYFDENERPNGHENYEARVIYLFSSASYVLLTSLIATAGRGICFSKQD
ncbi:hypothetical protein K439DRAFT_8218 [Ramaria rubella]|nr:hypothetical protein K439DRAFT_8218 [Ramaria rubella]